MEWEGDILLSPCPFWIRFCLLSDEFSSKISKLFWRWKLTSIRLIWLPAKLNLSYKKQVPQVGTKDEHFSCFHSSCKWGLSLYRLNMFKLVFVSGSSLIRFNGPYHRYNWISYKYLVGFFEKEIYPLNLFDINLLNNFAGLYSVTIWIYLQ